MSRSISTRIGMVLTAAFALARCQDSQAFTSPQPGALAALSTSSAILTGTADPFAYVTNSGSNTVSVIATATNSVVATVPVGTNPEGVAVTPDGGFVYVGNQGSGSISVIATATNAVVATIAVGGMPLLVAITPDGAHVYVASQVSNTVSVIATATNTVVATIPVSSAPTGLAIAPDGAHAYVSVPPGAVAVIATATNTVVASIPLQEAFGLAVTPDGAFLYAARFCEPPCGAGSVTVVATATNSVVADVGVGVNPYRVAITPDGAFAYVTNIGSVSVIATATHSVVATIPAGIVPLGVGITPDGAFVYVADAFSNAVAVISHATLTVVTSVAVGSAPRGVALTPAAAITPLAIDIKPGDGLNSINSMSHGTIPVALMSSAQIAVLADVDLTALTFGRTGSEPSLAFCAGSTDVNGDGLPDTVCHFRTRDAGFQPGDTEGILRGRMRAGAAFEGRDAVRSVR